jgi:diguanylate cyclase (GGDEF)-like protein
MASPLLPPIIARQHPGSLDPTPPPRPRNRLTLLSVALVLGIVGADWQIIRMQRDSAIANFKIAVNNVASGFSSQTYHAFMAPDPALRDIERSLSLRPQASAEEVAAMLRSPATKDLLVQRLLRLSGIDSLAIVDAGGQLVAQTRSSPSPATDLSQQDFFRYLSTRGAGGAFVGKPRLDPATGRWTSLLARRITGPQGRLAGVFLAEMSLADIEDIYRLGLPRLRRLTLLREDGTILARFPPEPSLIGKKVPAGDPWYEAAAGAGFTVGPGYLDAIPVVSAVRPLAGLPLFTEASVSLAEVLAGWRRELVWMILGGIVASTGAVLLVGLFGAQLQRLALRNAQLDEARRQLDAAISNISQGICFFDGEQLLLVCNRRFCEIYGLAPAAIQPGISLTQLVDHWFAAGGPANATRDDYLMGHAASLRAGEPHHSIIETATGRTIAVQQQPMPDGGWVATHEDITERRRAEDQISFMARHDVLTGLPNRAMLTERISHATTGMGRSLGFALLFLDLDRFKAINDTMGHAAGDALLQSVARRLRDIVGEGDTVARLGGDEFVVLQTDVAVPQTAASLAQRIIAAVGAPHAICGSEVVIGVSIGIDIAKIDKVTGERTAVSDVLKNADTALYIAKGEGRGTFRFFEPDMDAHVQNRHALERDLRCALERGEFILHYQAIVDAQTRRPRGYEALIRWNHPVRGLVGPQDFIPMAEETGLIIPIGEWAIRQACRDAAPWPAGLHVSVNLSPVQFRAADLVGTVRNALKAAGLAAARLELEITESVLLHSNERNLAVMHEFRASGIGIVMDDFGVGYSSLSYLRQFPFQRIKIDRCFVQDLGIRDDAVCVVRAILGLCRDLGIGTIAEGVETQQQMSVLLAEGCTDMQGTLFSQPEPASAIAPVLSTTRPSETETLPLPARIAYAM